MSTIDSNVGSGGANYITEQKRSPNVVFVSDQTGYIFGVDSDGTCVYWKTTNGGFSWNNAVTIYSGTDCLGTTIWYDRWTPGDTTGNYIHIVFADNSDDDLYYERLNTTDDSQLGEVNATGVNQGGTIAKTNSYSITKGTDGDLYLGTSDDADSFVIKCSSSCGTAGNWSEVGTNPMDADEDEIILRPLASGNILLINWDISAHWVRSKVYTDSSNSWDASWANIVAATDNTSFKHAFDAVVNPSNNNVYICVSNNPDNDANDIISGIYTSSWSTSTANIITNFAYEGCSIAFDQIKNEIYVMYGYSNLATYQGNTAFKKSTDYMTTWSSETSFNFGGGDSPNPWGFSFNQTSDNIIYGVAYDGGVDSTYDLQGETATENLIQSSWRWQNDNSAPNSNTNMANATTTISSINIGQRLTLRLQLENIGLQATTTQFILQFTTDVPTSTSPTWTNLSTSTAIATSNGGSTNGTAISSNVGGAPTGLTWANGTWHEQTAKTNSFTISASYYTEFGFMVDTANAAVNTTYYLRLYNFTATRALNSYSYYPTLATVSSSSNTQNYSFDGAVTTLSTATTSLSYYFDDLEYTRVSTSDNNYATTTATANKYPEFLFGQKHTKNTDVINFSWEGQTSLACSTQNIKVDVYNFNTSSWEAKVTNSTCSASTDFTATSTITSSISNYYDSNYWTYWRVYQNSSASTPTVKTDQLAITFSSPYQLHQTSWRFQNDDSPPNSNTNMAAATTTITNVKLGQRLTTRVQVENTGAQATTTSFVLQYCTGAASAQECSSWINLSTSTALSTAFSPSSASSGDSITAVVGGTPTSSASFSNGAWYEQTSTTTSYTLNSATHTEFGFVIDTHNAVENTTYYLRLYNQGINTTLDSYYFYPTLTTISSNTKIYTKEAVSSLASATSSLTYYLDDLGYTNVGTSDNTRESVTSTSQYPQFLFGEKNSNSTDQIDVSWEGQSDAACSTKTIYLQAYNVYTSSWVTRSSDTTCSAGSDTTITASITATISPNYFSSGWTYWRVYQDSTTATLQTDAMTFTFTTSGSQSNYVLTQTAYRFQSDDNAPNSNTNMAVANTAITSVKIGQRLTTVIQLKNTGSLSTTTTFTIQYCTGTDTAASCSSWLNLSTSTPISTASGSSNNNTAITSSLTGSTPTGVTWTNGAWFEERATTTSFSLTTEYYTELSFMISTQSATVNTKYYLRLYNNGSNTTLDSYSNYPTLTIVSTDNNTRYSKGIPSSLHTNNSASTFYFDDLEHTRSSSSDNTYATSTATANTYPLFVFTKKHTINSDEISFSWEGQTDLACATANLKLEVYNNSSSAWEAKTTNSSCSSDTDTTLTGSITSSLSNYYDSSYFTYWRVYQDSTANTPAFKTDYLSFTFTTPTPASSGTTSSPGGSGLPPTIYNPPTPPPAGFSVIINGNAQYTNTLNVTLTLTGGEDTKEMAISNEPNFINIGIEPYQTTKTWTLTLGEGEKTVYVKFYTQYGQTSPVVSDSIIYSLIATPEQTTPPGQTIQPGQTPTINLTTYQYLRKTTSQANYLFNNYVQGMILLRVENHGEAYYVLPDSNKVYYLKDGEVAYQIMSQTGLGINEKDYTVLRAKTNQGEALRRRLGGKIVLRAHAHGEAYYINPYTLVVTYLKDGSTAYELMRKQSLGISDNNLKKLINIE